MAGIFILIRNLNAGGAERQVSVLAEALHKKGHRVVVGVFYGGGVFEKQLRDRNITIYDLQKKSRWDIIGWFFRYLRALRQVRPDVIYSFLVISNIIAVISRLFHKIPVIWGIRASQILWQDFDRLSRVSAWIEKKLSAYPAAIIFNSQAGYRYHLQAGYNVSKAHVVPNGIHTNTFKPDAVSGKNARNHLNIPENAVFIGMVARVDPMKDYQSFIDAVKILSLSHDNLYALAVGQGAATTQWKNLPERFICVDDYQDISSIYNALDIMILCSHGEGFPNVIGEAMACGIPVIATDVGDCAHIIGETGIIIPPENSAALVNAIQTMLNGSLSGTAARDRIIDNFSVEHMTDNTLKILLPETCSL